MYLNIYTFTFFSISFHYIERSLAMEITLILDLLETMIQVASQLEIYLDLLGTVLRVVACISNPKYIDVTEFICRSVIIIFEFHNLLFDEKTHIC